VICLTNIKVADSQAKILKNMQSAWLKNIHNIAGVEFGKHIMIVVI